MKKSIGSKGISLIECINPRLTKYRVRFALAAYEDKEFGGGGVEFYELEYQYKPKLETIVTDIIAAIPDEPINLTEIATMAEILDEEPLEPMRKALLHNIEIYAKECLDVTNRHKALVSTLSGVDDVVNYDYTAGYPEKLSFNI